MRNKLTFPLFLFLTIVSTGLLISCEKIEQQQIQKAVIGQPAPDFSLSDTKGKTWKLSEQKGKVVFINFWATWCPPCREEMPSMQKLYSELPREKFEMLTILSNDDPLLANTFVARVGGTFQVLIDPDSLIANAYGLTGVPETFIIDKNGILREKFIGPRPWDSPEARKMIDQYL